jgi:elongation factor P
LHKFNPIAEGYNLLITTTYKISMNGGIAMISTNDLRPGVTVEIDGEVYMVIDFQHVKPGKGAAFVRTKIKNVKTGQVFERNFRAGERLNRAIVERKTMQYLYQASDTYYFMDTKTYEQIPLTKEQLGDAILYLKENLEVVVMFYEGVPIGVELPTFVELTVVDTEPGFKGDTATGGSKPATLETGAVIQVPLFIEKGDVVRVDTRTGEYLSRV